MVELSKLLQTSSKDRSLRKQGGLASFDAIDRIGSLREIRVDIDLYVMIVDSKPHLSNPNSKILLSKSSILEAMKIFCTCF